MNSSVHNMGLVTDRLSKDVVVSLLLVLATTVALLLWKAFLALWWKPHRIQKVFEAQGIKCLPRPLISGNLPEFVAFARQARALPMPQVSHDIAPRILPHLYKWSEKYGELFVYWFGSQARVILAEPEQAKEMLSTKSGHYSKAGGRPDTKDLVGEGLVSIDGEKWARHRRIMNPAFFVEKLKAMAPTMATCTASVLEAWEDRVANQQDIDVHQEFRALTGDIIAHTAFGTSFAEGKQVFELQREQLILMNELNRSIYIPGSRFLPTATNRYRWKLNNGITKILHQLVQKRLDSTNMGRADLYGNDLLGLMMAANKGDLQGNQKNLSLDIGEMIDECKTFFFAGHETTSTLLTWTFLLLASSPEWQERVREEVHEVCGRTELPTAESINNLRTVTMVLNEAIRLYPPAVALFRKATSDMKLGKIVIPRGTVLIVPIIKWHHDQKYWGSDADEFRPDRFNDGIVNAFSVAGAYLPFSMGPRNCIGQTFAMLEAKVVLATILQRYRFHLSPTYRHSPTIVLTLQPEFGIPLLFEKL